MRNLSRFVCSMLLALVPVAANAALAIYRISPPYGPTSGGTVLTIDGNGFYGGCAMAPCLPVQVTVNRIPATSIHVESDTRITAVTPERNQGIVIYKYEPEAIVVRLGAEEVLQFQFRYTDVVPLPDLSGFQRILLPTYNCNLPGAQGSVWCTDLYVFNGSAAPVTLYPVYPNPSGGSIAAASIPGKRFAELSLLQSIAKSFTEVAPVSSRVLRIEPSRADDLRFNLRLYDRSRSEISWGTEVPVVREKDLRTAAIEIFPVPMDPRFRSSLRIYDPFRLANAEVEVRFHLADSGRLLATKRVALSVFERPMQVGQIDQSFPGIAEFHNLQTDFPELGALSASDQLRIEIVPMTPGLRFWAMASLTNMVTQQVTLLTPQ